MNNQIKTIAWSLLAAISISLFFKWNAVNAPVKQETVVQTSQQVNSNTVNPNQTAGNVVSSTGSSTGVSVATNIQPSKNTIKVTTDKLEITIDTVGGTLLQTKLLTYSESLKDKTPINLLEPTAGKLFIAKTELLSNFANNANALAVFSSKSKSYTMKGDSISIPLIWEKDGVKVIKTYTFKKGKFDFTISQKVVNNSGKDWTGYQINTLSREKVDRKGGLSKMNTFTGGAYSTDERKYQKLDFDELADGEGNISNVKGGWVAMIQHYFVVSLVPAEDEKTTFFSLKNNASTVYDFGIKSSAVTLKNGQETTFNIVGYIGPKIKKDLKKISPTLDKSIDYGWAFMISEVLFNVLNWFHGILGNWGWATIVVTILIKLLFFPLAAKSFKSMAKMRKFAPEIELIKKKYKEDKQRLGKETMALYKKEGINPAAGCLPMLVQIPVFIAFYYMLMESVEFRQAPWILWVKDLSIKDPLYVIPVINAVLMFVQQRLNPPPADPTQRKIMMMLPIVFGVMFLMFPAGLVLYWCVSNLFSIIQQYLITKRYGSK